MIKLKLQQLKKLLIKIPTGTVKVGKTLDKVKDDVQTFVIRKFNMAESFNKNNHFNIY